MQCDIFLVAGEKSGDLQADRLIRSLLHADPHLKLAGVGGPLMRAHPFECIFPMENLQVMGFIDVFLALPKLIRSFYTVADAILKMQPKAVITIDYPGFNLRLARHLRKKGFKGKLIHFVCPSVWAWGKKRIPLMANTLDLLLCILPFEPAFFQNTSLKTLFIGNPLQEKVASHPYQPLHLPQAPIISLFPGSRKKEIVRNLPLMLQASAALYQENPSFAFALSVADPLFMPLIRSIADKIPSLPPLTYVPISLSYELMQASFLALAKSGTVTLELALHRIPTVVIYAISKFDQWIAYTLLKIRLPFYCLVNIIANKQVFPELIGASITPKQIEQEACRLCDAQQRRAVEQDCDAIISALAKTHTAHGAQAILDLL